MLTAQAERLDRQFLGRRSWAYLDWRDTLSRPSAGRHPRPPADLDGRRAPVRARRRHRYAHARRRSGRAHADRRRRLWHPIAAARRRGHRLAAAGWRPGGSPSRSSRPTARSICSPTPSGTPGPTRTGSPGTSCASTSSTPWPRSAAGGTGCGSCVDDAYPPATRELPQWGLRAEYWIEGIGESEDDDITESGAYLRLATDQVRFYPIDAPEQPGARGRRRVPRAARWRREPSTRCRWPGSRRSSSARSCATSTCSSAWPASATTRPGRTAAPSGRHREYWTSYGFGELSETGADPPRAADPARAAAGDRRPRPPSRAASCDVRGDLRTYRIHLGSGNILIDPNERYLCIVPSARSGAAEDRIPALRGRPHAGGDPQQGIDARQGHGDHRPHDHEPALRGCHGMLLSERA